MAEVKYIQIVEAEFEKLVKWFQQREEADLNIAKSKQLIFAALNMVPDKERKAFEDKLDTLASADVSTGLTDSIKNALLRNFPKRMTAAMVRDELVRARFDFSQYSTNPLASISTILRRLKPEEVKAESVEGVTTYRLTSSYAKQMRKRKSLRSRGGTHGFTPLDDVAIFVPPRSTMAEEND